MTFLNREGWFALEGPSSLKNRIELWVRVNTFILRSRSARQSSGPAPLSNAQALSLPISSAINRSLNNSGYMPVVTLVIEVICTGINLGYIDYLHSD